MRGVAGLPRIPSARRRAGLPSALVVVTADAEREASKGWLFRQT